MYLLGLKESSTLSSMIILDFGFLFSSLSFLSSSESFDRSNGKVMIDFGSKYLIFIVEPSGNTTSVGYVRAYMGL